MQSGSSCVSSIWMSVHSGVQRRLGQNCNIFCLLFSWFHKGICYFTMAIMRFRDSIRMPFLIWWGILRNACNKHVKCIVGINIWDLLLHLWPHSGISSWNFQLAYFWNESPSVIVTASFYWLSCFSCNIFCINELINLRLPVVKFISVCLK